MGETAWVQWMIQDELVDGAEWGRGRNTMGLVDDTGCACRRCRVGLGTIEIGVGGE